MKKTSSPNTIIVGPVRLSYLQVFAPRENALKKGKMELSCRILIPKLPHKYLADPKAEGKGINEAIKAIMAESFPKLPPVWNNPLKDGDTEIGRNTGEPKHPGFWFMQCTTTPEYPPVLLDSQKRKVTGGWQSGDWGYVMVKFFTYDTDGNKGVSASLQAIQFCYHDEPFGGAPTADQVAGEFGTVADGEEGLATTTQDEVDPFQD